MRGFTVYSVFVYPWYQTGTQGSFCVDGENFENASHVDTDISRTDKKR